MDGCHNANSASRIEWAGSAYTWIEVLSREDAPLLRLPDEVTSHLGWRGSGDTVSFLVDRLDPCGSKPLLACFSHLRWDFVFQRPQQLLTRASRDYHVIYFEEPIWGKVARPRLVRRPHASGVEIATPHLPEGIANPEVSIRRLVDTRLRDSRPHKLLTWYYTPMALKYTSHLTPDVCVYDCMDELSQFKNAPSGLAEWEEVLISRADIVFTGGLSLYEAKRSRHPRVYVFPSSIDLTHFAPAKTGLTDPADQANLVGPRIGFFGVIDERMDVAMVAKAAAECSEIQFIMLGPVIKIDPKKLPKLPNLHWLGPKPYAELPAYLSHWDSGWMPFALNAATQYISPTKTPEFLAAGLPVTSTAVKDVAREYGHRQFVEIADSENITASLRASLTTRGGAWWEGVHSHLARTSWDSTWSSMALHINKVARRTFP